MEEVKWNGKKCCRIEAPQIIPEISKIYDYDREPEEIAVYSKGFGKWTFVTRTKRALNFLKIGKLVLSQGYLYGEPKYLKKFKENLAVEEDAITFPIVDSIQELMKSGVFTEEEARDRLSRYVSAEQLSSLMENR